MQHAGCDWPPIWKSEFLWRAAVAAEIAYSSSCWFWVLVQLLTSPNFCSYQPARARYWSDFPYMPVHSVPTPPAPLLIARLFGNFWETPWQGIRHKHTGVTHSFFLKILMTKPRGNLAQSEKFQIVLNHTSAACLSVQWDRMFNNGLPGDGEMMDISARLQLRE